MRQGRDGRIMESSKRLARILEEGKKVTIDPTYLSSTPRKSQDATVSRFKQVHDEMQEQTPPFNNIEAHSILLDERTHRDPIYRKEHIRISPSSQGLPIAAPSVPNPYNEVQNISKSISELLNQPQTKLLEPELRFDITMEAAVSNFELLKTRAYDLKKLCNGD